MTVFIFRGVFKLMNKQVHAHWTCWLCVTVRLTHTLSHCSAPRRTVAAFLTAVTHLTGGELRQLFHHNWLKLLPLRSRSGRSGERREQCVDLQNNAQLYEYVSSTCFYTSVLFSTETLSLRILVACSEI